MSQHPLSQADPLPANLPFQIISGTIGRGAYASIRKAVQPGSSRVFAVKLIHKPSLIKHGKASIKQLEFEVSLHKYCSGHQNIITFLGSDHDQIWRWIAMEYAESGDLFDKIEADVGVSEDIAHFYFKQLIAGVSFMHGKGVAHRDIKPENMLLDRDGNLKIADFGLACLYQHKGVIRTSNTLCGSPPYVAPEVAGGPYRGDYVDIWSCGIVLFVLLAGNTPWDEPTKDSYEFCDYLEHNGRVNNDLWAELPIEVLSLLRGIMKINPKERFSIDDIRRHPWFCRPNPYLTEAGLCSNPLYLATSLLENLHVSFGEGTKAASPEQDEMDMDTSFSFTQPDPANRPSMSRRSTAPSSQPTANSHVYDILADEPSMSQFCSSAGKGAVSQSLTQNAQKFRDICPPTSLTEFFSASPPSTILSVLSEALHRAGVSVPGADGSEMEGYWYRVKTRDTRKCPMEGDVLVEHVGQNIYRIRFSKAKGDPVEWRRFFKKVCAGCKEVVIVH